MAEHVDKSTLSGHDNDTTLTNGTVSNYITQINAGGTVYDIATHHGIKFLDGKNDTTGMTWNGLTDLVITIPTVADIVENPIEFVGVVKTAEGAADNAAGYVENEAGETVTTFKKGELVWISKNCIFGGKQCEKGDMAVYDGTTWYVVSGENQISITGTDETTGVANVVLNATAKEVLNVEGNKLQLSVDYKGVKDVLSVSKNADNKIDLADGTTTVKAKYLTLKKAADSTPTIGVEKTITTATALADGTVTINGKVLTKNDFSWSAGTAPVLQTNTNTIAVTASLDSAPTINITDGGTGVVKSIDGAIKSAELTGTKTFVTEITKSDDTDKVFVTGLHLKKDTEKAEDVKISIPNAASFTSDSTTTFVKGLGDASTAGDNILVSNVEVGAVTGTFLTGLTNKGTTVVTGFATNGSGSVSKSTGDWFYSGLGTEGTSGDVVSSITTGSASLTTDSGSTFATSVMNSAKVENHILSFGTTNVMSPVKVSYTAPTAKYKSFTTSGVSYTAPTLATDTFATGSVSQAASTISYKSLATGSIALKDAGTSDYVFETGNANKYTVSTATVGLDTEKATIATASLSASKPAVTASIPAKQVVTGFATAPVLPSWSIATSGPSGTLSGSVATTLSTTENKFYAVNEDAISLTIPGAYSLVGSDSSSEGAIEVGAAGQYDVSGSTTVPANSYITAVNVDGTAVSVKA